MNLPDSDEHTDPDDLLGFEDFPEEDSEEEESEDDDEEDDEDDEEA